MAHVVFTDFIPHQLLADMPAVQALLQQAEEKGFLLPVRVLVVATQQAVLAEDTGPQAVQ